jgi:glutamine phosphoribosylpyrophosphate amidotransferase
MCNLNVFVKQAGANILYPIISASAVSFIHNSHGEGVFTSSDGNVVKTKQKIDYTRHAEALAASEVVITHQRIATSGFSLRYLHPFQNSRFVLAHNGVLNCAKGGKSDTAVFFERFLKNFEKNSHFTIINDRMKASIEQTIKSVDGSYSIVIFDKTEKKLWYFKNSGTQISITQTKDGGLFLTTNKDNLAFVKVKTNYTVEANHLYLLGAMDGDTLALWDYGAMDIPEPVIVNHPVVYAPQNYNYGGYGGLDNGARSNKWEEYGGWD